MTTSVGTDLEPLIAGLEKISAGRIAVRHVKIDDMRPDSRSLVVVYLTPPDHDHPWNLDDFSSVRVQVRDLVSSSALGDDARITYSRGDASARTEPAKRETKALAGRRRAGLAASRSREPDPEEYVLPTHSSGRMLITDHRELAHMLDDEDVERTLRTLS